MGRSLSLFLLFSLLTLSARAGNVDTFGIGSKATALGGAFSAYADDPFAVYYNPAGLAQIERPILSAGVLTLNPTIKVHFFRAVDGDGNRVEPYGISFKDSSKNLIVPHFGFATPLFNNLYFGIGVYVP